MMRAASVSLRAARQIGVGLLLLSLGHLPATAAPAGAPAAGERSVEATLTLGATGDALLEATVRFPEAEMADVKERSPAPARFFTRLCPSRPDYVLDANPSVAYGDDAAVLRAKGTLQGLARHRGGGVWEALLGADYLQGAPAPGPDAGRAWDFDVLGQLDGDHPYVGQTRVLLPEGARDASWDAQERRLRWTLDAPRAPGAASLNGKVQGAPRVISAAYKVYTVAKGFVARHVPLKDGSEIVFGADVATPWVGRAVLRNAGPGTVSDLRVRWKLEDYTAEWSAAEKFPEVLPGQTVVSVYYPVIQPSIARLRDDTKANLLVKWSWVDETGKTHEDDDAGRVTLLGVNNFAFSDLGPESQFGSFAEKLRNGPLLAAWVSRNDGVVTQFGALANKNAGGVAASVSDANAVKALRACYELLLINNVTYQSPPATVQSQGQSFDSSVVQTVRFPRDVIKNRSGTCIDLAILYAAMLNAVGLNPMLVLIDGHCFPAVILPSGGIVAVESTGVGGGLAGSHFSFDEALGVGTKSFGEARLGGRYMLIPVQEMWEAEILTPELEELPADILQRWGITGTPPQGMSPARPAPEPGTPTGPGTAPGPTPGPSPGATPSPAPAPAAPPAGIVYDTSAVVADGWKVIREGYEERVRQQYWVLEAVSDKNGNNAFYVTYYDEDMIELFVSTAFCSPSRVSVGGKTKASVDVPWGAIRDKARTAVVKPRRD